MTDVSISILGGGIGGLCAALALRQVGFEPTVYERTDELRPVGSGIWIPPNGMAALEVLGVAEAVEERGVALDRTVIRTTTGRTLTSTDLRARASAVGLERTMVSIRRSALQDVLVDRLPNDSLELGMEGAAVDPERPAIRFADGTERTADLVVGADGIRSITRRTLFPEQSVRYAGGVTYRGLVETPLPDRASRDATAIWGRSKRFGYSAVGRNRAWWFAVLPADAPDEVPELGADELAERYDDFPDPVSDLVAATDRLVRTPLTDLPPLERWHRNRVTLLGDAAHAMTPNLAQGSAQAMEDAVVLAACLREQGVGRRALREYESRRKPRADRISRQSRLQGRLGQLEHPILIGVRNAVFRLMPSAVMGRQVERQFAVDF
ncbi:FAD-dependent monooxygenase [Halobacteria archaeon AArc-m2/3/4]|uniref:FAD-dependent monooxygenase n=1 Tax=Natronoglomus mannanivorans TaxID=2979990 RepID=A0ABT2Q8K3_9EURY|nr:FAD-dependent monooxygenase [Halobacteria archaeon AArc-m2/3/4]